VQEKNVYMLESILDSNLGIDLNYYIEKLLNALVYKIGIISKTHFVLLKSGIMIEIWIGKKYN